MTPQLPPDSVIYQEQDHALILIRGDRLTAPRHLGLQVAAHSTACYRGYVATYTCMEDELYLTGLHVEALARGDWTPIDGVEPETVHRTGYVIRNGEKQPSTWTDGKRYQGLRVPTGFSGGLLIGGGRYGSIGAFILPSACEQVLELYFHEGTLLRAVDHSAQVAALRASLPPKSYGVQEQIDWLAALGYDPTRARLSPDD